MLKRPLAVQLDVQAVIDQFDSRKVQLVHTTGFPTDVDFNDPVAGVFQLGETPLFLLPIIDVVKQDEDLIRMIGHQVVDPGPLGFDSSLPGDGTGVFGGSFPASRGIDNQH